MRCTPSLNQKILTCHFFVTKYRPQLLLNSFIIINCAIPQKKIVTQVRTNFNTVTLYIIDKISYFCSCTSAKRVSAWHKSVIISRCDSCKMGDSKTAKL